ncbi:MAG: hypothetical protein Q4F41_12040 [Eubacteriales bacterium]|nr:hypothetical protein [Eubacteriales bacterium]
MRKNDVVGWGNGRASGENHGKRKKRLADCGKVCYNNPKVCKNLLPAVPQGTAPLYEVKEFPAEKKRLRGETKTWEK